MADRLARRKPGRFAVRAACVRVTWRRIALCVPLREGFTEYLFSAAAAAAWRQRNARA